MGAIRTTSQARRIREGVKLARRDTVAWMLPMCNSILSATALVKALERKSQSLNRRLERKFMQRVGRVVHDVAFELELSPFQASVLIDEVDERYFPSTFFGYNDVMVIADEHGWLG